VSGAYEIAVRINRAHGGDESNANRCAECLLGISLHRDQCGQALPVIDLTWHLRALDGSALHDTLGNQVSSGHEQGNSASSAGNGEMIERSLVGFDGIRGKRYSLQLELKSDLTPLEAFAPRVVGPAGSLLKDSVVRDFSVLIVAFLICVLGLIAIAVAAVVRIREWRLG